MQPIKPFEITSLPPLPIAIVKLARVFSDSEKNIIYYRHIIEKDPVLTGSVIRWANSSWGNGQSSITTIENAVARLGIDNILQLALGVHMISTMRTLLGIENISENEIWRHSLATALATKILSDYMDWPIPIGAFSAAIIHDIGKILIVRHLTFDQTKEIFDQTMEQDKITYIEAKEKLLKTNHVKLGIKIARQWKLPKELIATIANHHDLEKNDSPILKVVQLGNAITKKNRITAGTSQKDIANQFTLLENAGIKELEMHEIENKLETVFQQVIGYDWHH